MIYFDLRSDVFVGS